MDGKLETFLNAVENEGLDYAVVFWSDWTDLQDDYPELYGRIQVLKENYLWLESFVEDLEKKYDSGLKDV